MRYSDYDDFSSLPESEILKRKRPAVYTYEPIIYEGQKHLVRVGCGWWDKPLPYFEIPFVVSGNDYVMISNPHLPHPSNKPPKSTPPMALHNKQREFAL